MINMHIFQDLADTVAIEVSVVSHVRNSGQIFSSQFLIIHLIFKVRLLQFDKLKFFSEDSDSS